MMNFALLPSYQSTMNIILSGQILRQLFLQRLSTLDAISYNSFGEFEMLVMSSAYPFTLCGVLTSTFSRRVPIVGIEEGVRNHFPISFSRNPFDP